MSIFHKLISAFGFVVLLTFISAIIVFVQLEKISDKEQQVVDVSIPVVAQSKEIERHIQQSLSALRAYLIHGASPQRAEHFQTIFEQAWLNIEDSVAKIHSFNQIQLPEPTLQAFHQLMTCNKKSSKYPTPMIICQLMPYCCLI